MEAPAPQSISLSQHIRSSNNVSTGKTLYSDNSGHWSLVNGLSKDKSESWAGLGTPRTSRGKLLSQSSPVSANALRSIYSAPSLPMPLTSEGIVVQALNVVADNAASHLSPYGEPSLKKISKRRRKANGGVDVEHTKSNNEFLRKLQLSLRGSNDDSEEEKPESSEDDSYADQLSSPPGEPLSMPMKDSSHSEGDDHSSTTSRTTASTLSDSSHRNTSDRSSDLQKDIGGGSASNEYGYEDPDKTMAPADQAQRVPRVARRRGSVTEHTIRAVQRAAAIAAAERAQSLRLSRTNIISGQSVASLAAAAAQRLQNLHGSSANSPFNRRRSAYEQTAPRMQIQSRRMSAPDNPYGYGDAAPSTAATSSSNNTSNPFGYEDMDMPDASKNKQDETLSNPYGYEDPDASSRQDVSNAFGYEDPDASKPYAPPSSARPRARRRGSVTKYSLDAAKSAAAASEAVQPSSQDAVPRMTYKRIVPSGPVQPARTLSPKPEQHAPDQPSRMLSPWQTQQNHQSSSFAARKSALARTSKALGPPVVHVPPTKTESFRTKHSREMPNDSSDDEHNDDCSTSDDESIDDSVTSITIPLKDIDDTRDGPMRPPSRHDSLRSFASRSSSHSVRSIDSDGDSLAPDMKSLCSISQHERNVASGSAPPPPMYLPHTPTPRTQSRKLPRSHSASRKGVSMQSLQGDEGSAPLTYVDTSPLASPMIQGKSFCSRPPSFQGSMIYQPDFDMDPAGDDA